MIDEIPKIDPISPTKIDYHRCAGKYACRSNTRYRPSHNEGLRVRRTTADGRSDFKNKDGDQEDSLGRVEGVHLAPG
jgi:hypothetical protein